MELGLQGVRVQRWLAVILVLEVGQYYLHGHTVYNHSFEVELVEQLAVEQHTGVLQMGIAVLLLEQQSLTPEEINSELMALYV